MNLIIDDNDHQLIIKVASIPSARVQIYFIDNEDYFHRKAIVSDENGFFDDNDERAIFFARGVLETVKKLRWTPISSISTVGSPPSCRSICAIHSPMTPSSKR